MTGLRMPDELIVRIGSYLLDLAHFANTVELLILFGLVNLKLPVSPVVVVKFRMGLLLEDLSQVSCVNFPEVLSKLRLISPEL